MRVSNRSSRAADVIGQEAILSNSDSRSYTCIAPLCPARGCTPVFFTRGRERERYFRRGVFLTPLEDRDYESRR